MDANTLGLIFTGVAGLLLLLSFVFGLIRGVKKTIFRFFWLLISLVLVILLTPSISKTISQIDISGLNLNIYGKVYRISDIGLNILEEFAKTEPAILNSGAIRVVAESVPILILNTFIFVILFWLLKWILWPAWALISSRIFDKEKREQELLKKQRKNILENQEIQNQDQNEDLVFLPNTKKKRFFGGLLGLLIGFLLCIVTFCPIIGFNNIYQKAYFLIETNKEEQTVYLAKESQNIKEEEEKLLEYVESYQNSIINKIFTYTGVNLLSDTLFSTLSVVKVADEKINLKDEVNTAIKIYNNIDVIGRFDYKNLSEESIDKVITAVKEIFINIEDSKIVYFIGDDIVPYYISTVINDENIRLLDGGRFDEIIISAYNSYANGIGLNELKIQAEALLDVVMNLNNKNLIVPILNEEIKTFDDFCNLIDANIKNQDDFTNTIVNNFYRVDMLKAKYPDILNEAFKSLFKLWKLDYQEQEISNSILKDDFKKIVTNLLSFSKYYAKSNNYDFADNTVYAFSNVGKILDTLKNDFFNEENYQVLTNYLLSAVNSEISSFANFSEILEVAKNINSWEEELTEIAGTYKAIVQFINDGVTEEKILDENSNKLENIGIALDGAIRGKSILVTNSNIRKALETILNSIDTSSISEILNIELEDSLILKDYVLNNIYNEAEEENKSKITNWQKEIKINLGLIKKVYPIVEENFNLQKLSSEDNNQLVEIGKELDILVGNTNLLLSNNVIKAIANYYLTNKVVFPEEIGNILNSTSSSGKTIYQDVLGNINNNNKDLVWETEFSKIKSLLNISYEEDEFDLINIGKNLDNVFGSKIITKPIITEIISNYIKENTTKWTGETLTAVRNGLIANLGKIESYAIEFDYIAKLLSIVDNYGSELGEYVDLIGTTFNEICGITTDYESKVLTAPIVNDILKYFVDTQIIGKLEEGLIQVISSLEDNFQFIKDYQLEFDYLYNLILSVNNKYDANNDSVCDLKDVGNVIDKALSIAENNTTASEIINVEIVANIVAYFIDIKSDGITDSTLIGIIEKIKNNFKNTDIVVYSYETEFTNIINLFSIIDSNNTDVIGLTLDSIRNNSVVLDEEILNDLVLYFFDQNTLSYTTGEYESIVSSMRTNIKGIKNNKSKKYSSALKELDIIVDAINELSALEDLQDFASNEDIGYYLDELESLQIVCNKEIAYDISNKIVENLLTLLNSYEMYKTAVEEVLNSQKYDYYNYETNGYSYKSDYYTDLINTIKQVLPSNI